MERQPCPSGPPREEGLTDLLEKLHTSGSVLQSLWVSNHQHRPLALKINQAYKMKRGSKHNLFTASINKVFYKNSTLTCSSLWLPVHWVIAMLVFGISGIVQKKLESLFSNIRCYRGQV